MSDNGTAARGAGEATPAAGVAAVAAGAATNLEQRARMAGLPVLEGAAPPNIGQVCVGYLPADATNPQVQASINGLVFSAGEHAAQTQAIGAAVMELGSYVDGKLTDVAGAAAENFQMLENKVVATMGQMDVKVAAAVAQSAAQTTATLQRALQDFKVSIVKRFKRRRAGQEALPTHSRSGASGGSASYSGPTDSGALSAGGGGGDTEMRDARHGSTVGADGAAAGGGTAVQPQAGGVGGGAPAAAAGGGTALPAANAGVAAAAAGVPAGTAAGVAAAGGGAVNGGTAADDRRRNGNNGAPPGYGYVHLPGRGMVLLHLQSREVVGDRLTGGAAGAVPPVGHTSGSKARVPQPQKYSGEGHEAVEDVIFAFENYLKGSKLDQAEWPTHAMPLLTGKALQAYIAYAQPVQAAGEQVTWEQFCDVLLTFARPDRQLSARASLMHLKQVSTVQKFVTEFKILKAKCGNPQPHDKDLMLAFWHGLKKEVKDGCKVNPSTGKFWDTFTALSDHVLAVELAKGITLSPGADAGTVPRPASVNGSGGGWSRFKGKKQPRGPARLAAVQAGRVDKLRNGKGGRGGYNGAAGGQDRGNGNQANGGDGAGPSGGRGDVTCHNCGGRGHKSFQCSSAPKGDGKGDKAPRYGHN